MPKHLSIDFWHTLATPNPKWAPVRTELIATHCRVPTRVAEAAYTAAKTFIDMTAIRTGRAFSTEEAWHLLVMSLTGHRDDNNRLMYMAQNRFKEHPPTFDAGALNTLGRLMREFGVTWNVSSNTNFIKGSTLIELCEETVDSFPPPAFYSFSDAVGYAKPSIHFFAHVVSQAARICEVAPANTWHIGDDPNTDAGCIAMGIEYRRISPGHSPSLVSALGKAWDTMRITTPRGDIKPAPAL